MRIPYLKKPVFANGQWLHADSAGHYRIGDQLAAAIESLFTESAPIALTEDDNATLPECLVRPPAEWSKLVGNLIGTFDVPLARHYDCVVVEQGYGGVFVHATDLVASLRQRWRVLFIAPGDPFFGAGRHADDLTLPRLQEIVPGTGYFSYVSCLRAVLRMITSNLLLVTHRSQATYLFDLMTRHPTVIYCDGFFDAAYLAAKRFPESARPTTRTVLREIMYLLAQSHPSFHGLPSTPNVNSSLLWAGYWAVIAARENWCWGSAQRVAFAGGAPSLAARLKIQLPFINAEIFHPTLVNRSRIALFTTTMHNIEKKGIDPILNALRDVPDLQVLGVVRQPQFLPRIPRNLAKRLQITTMSKAEILTKYHQIWINCRISSEESSPVSVLESMACEVPQIVSPAVAQQIPLLEDGVTGYIVAPEDRQRIASCLRRLLEDRHLRDTMGQAARARALKCSTSLRLTEFGRLIEAPSYAESQA